MSEFVESLAEVFAAFGPVSAKPMFGGFGIYHDDLMFGLVADDVLYLKADDLSKGAFLDRGLQAFEYVKQGKVMRMSYYAAPDEIFDDTAKAREWAGLAFEASLRASRARSARKRK